jgi:rhodanese-related sulfurtransferase
VSYAGDITPEQAWEMLAGDPQAVLVDCRTEAEWRFVDDLIAAGVAPAQRPVVFLCRSGNRSIGAAESATAAGIAPSYNVLDGFEGNLDGNGHRGRTGWKALGLPWVQS